MCRFLIIPLLLGLSSPVQAEIDPKVREACLPAADFLGCVKAYTTKSSDTQNLRVIEGERELTGNICAANQAYIGGGYCQRVMCDGLNWWVREFSARHDSLLEGKGWECQGQKKLLLTGPPIKATTSNKCPMREPIIGTPSSCTTQADIDLMKLESMKKKKKPLACRNGTWSPNHPQCKDSEEQITSPMDMD